MSDETAVELAALKVEMRAATKAIEQLASTIAVDSQRSASELAAVRGEIHDLRLRMAEHYATTAALERVREDVSTKHRFAMDRLELVAGRVNTLEDADARHQGVTLGIRTFLLLGGGLIGAASGVAAVVTAVIG